MPTPKIDVVIGANVQPLAAGVAKARNSLNSLVPSGLTGTLGRFISGGLAIGFARQVLQAADQIKTLADRTGLTTDAIQELKFAADETGSSIESFTTSFRALIKAQQDALQGREGNPTQAAFERLGISLDEVRRLDPENIFRRVGEAIKRAELSGEQLDAVFSVLGKTAMEVLPAMKEGLDGLAKSARDSGVIIKQELVEPLSQANDTSERLGRQLTAIAAIPVGGLLYLIEGAKLLMGSMLNDISTGNLRTGKAQMRRDTMGELLKAFEEGTGLYFGVGDLSTGPLTPDQIQDARARRRRAPYGTPTATGEVFGPPLPPDAATGEVFGPPLPPDAATGPQAAIAVPAADALARIGGFRGGYDPTVIVGREQLRAIQSVDRKLGLIYHELRAEE